MIKGLGIDALDISRMEKAMRRQGFLDRVFTDEERGYINGKSAAAAQSAAGLFAAKEAVAKALGTGVNGFGLKDISLTHTDQGAPECTLYAGARKRMLALQAGAIYVNITHTDITAFAVCVIE